MQENLMPEAIRGSWYLIPEKIAAPTAAQGALKADQLADKGQLITFGIDGTFETFELKSDYQGLKTQPKDQGDYTFDGDFLILRGRNTETFRVDLEAPWCWALEARKKRARLVRGVLGTADFITLDPEEAQQIDIFAARVQVESAIMDDSPAIYELIFDPADGDRLRLASFSVDIDTEYAELWLGITALVEGLSPETWQKIITHAFLPGHRKQLEGIQRVAVELLGIGVIRHIDLS